MRVTSSLVAVLVCAVSWRSIEATSPDVSKCLLNNGGCSPNATCTGSATDDIVSCDCKVGFTGDGITCTDVNECASNNGDCGPGATCINTPGSYTCTYMVQYSPVNGYVCFDINECLTNNGGCSEDATCDNNPGSFTCTCRPGYAGSGFTCSDVNECLVNNGGCSLDATCTNTPGSFFCTCKPGFSGDGFTCTDNNECSRNRGGCHSLATCYNTPGTFKCICNVGYYGNGFSCYDYNECLSNNGGCSIWATCSNTHGSFYCTCKPGFTGNGFGCSEIDECHINNGGCSEHATCINRPGSVACTCRSGFVGNGYTCTDINECLENNGGCASNRSCINTPGSYYCDDGQITTPVPSAVLRLVGGPNYAEGRLEVFYNHVWGTVCDDGFNNVDAGVACRSMGYGFVDGYTLGNLYGPGTGQIWLDDIQCWGYESSLSWCRHNGWGTHNCAHNEDVSIRCVYDSPTMEAPVEQTTESSVKALRLVGGESNAVGRLEVYNNHVWGTVCDDDFQDVDAGVACRSLGLGYTHGYTLHNRYGPGTDPIWLDNVHCWGHETSFFDCPNNGWGNHNCQHSEDVSIGCYNFNGSHPEVTAEVETATRATRSDDESTWDSVYDTHPDHESTDEFETDSQPDQITTPVPVSSVIIMNRPSRTSSWDLPWSSYKNGFNLADSGYWLGLEQVHRLTSSASYRLLVEFVYSHENTWRSVEYQSFVIGDEKNTQYTLSISGYLQGSESDRLAYHNGMKFSTRDRDNDLWSSSCAQLNSDVGWWFKFCWDCCLTCITPFWGTNSHNILSAVRMTIILNQ